ncbi:MAG: SRPBCC domain-containing protein [Candidatus Roizmanbacteria bacterium]|nr:SRPBCC domain-containing protein [Candidatus Roizmanbacteria bacterium]
MKTLHFSIQINAPKKKVWEVMLGDKTYREWTTIFMPGSHFVGNWNKDTKMQFLAPNEDGKMGGMTSEVADSIPYELISIKHVGLVTDGVEDTTSSEAKKWVGYEKYRFMDVVGKTELMIEVDTTHDFVSFMKDTWPKALQTIKELAEK